MEAQRLAFANRWRFFLGRLRKPLIVILLLQLHGELIAAEKFRAASGGFGTAIHAVNSIPTVCRARPGVRTFLDMPIISSFGALR